MQKIKIRFKNLFVIIFVSYIIVLIVPLVMTLAVYLQSENVLQEKIIDSNFAVLRQIQSTVDDRLDEIDHLSSQILINPQTVSLMYTSSILNANKRMTVFNLLKDFSSYKNITPFIDDFFVYFHNIDYMITSTSSCTPQFYYKSFIESEQPYEDWRDTVLQSIHSGKFILSQMRADNRNTKPMLFFWRSLPAAAGMKPLGNICIQVDFYKFKNLLASSEEIDGGMAYVLNSSNEVFIYSPHAAEILPIDASLFTGDKGELVHKLNNTEYVFTYMKSKESGLTYITAFPRSILQADVEHMRHYTQIAIYICVLIALVLIFILTYGNYKPIQKIAVQFGQDDAKYKEANAFRYIEQAVQNITNRNRQFSEEMKRHLPLFRSTFLRKLIYGSAIKGNELAEAAESYNIHFQYEDFMVILLHIDDSSQFVKDNSEEDHNFVKLILGNISEELAGSIGFGCLVETEPETMCLILNLPSLDPEESQKAVSMMVERIKHEIEAYFKIIITIAVGRSGSGIGAIHSSYLEAMHALDYRMIRGISSIIYADDLNHNSSFYHYPAEVENHLINYVRSGEYDNAKKLINDLFTENFQHRRLSLPVGKCLFFDIISTAIKLLDMINVDFEEIFGEVGPIEKLLQCETVQQAQDTLLYVFKKLCEYINGNKRSHNDQMKTDIVKYIEETYGDEKLCQTMIADHFNISPNYLSNFFHEQVGKKMSVYISSIRIVKTKELLRDTDLGISQIAEKVGFGSDLSLIRVFKKMEGLTPGQYRSQVRK